MDKTSILCFYSTIAQSMAALIAVSGVYAIFRIQSIDAQLARSYTSYREWINIRLICFNVDKIYRNGLQQNLARECEDMLSLGPSIEPNSWLEKDILDHAEDLYQKAEAKNSNLKKALRDYTRHFKNQLFFKYITIVLSILPILISCYLLFNSINRLFLLDQNNLSFSIKGVVQSIVCLRVLLVYMIFYISITMFGPFEINDNNPKH